MNSWMIAGGLAGVCLMMTFVWLMLCATYDAAYRNGFNAGRAFGRKEV